MILPFLLRFILFLFILFIIIIILFDALYFSNPFLRLNGSESINQRATFDISNVL